MAGLAAIRKRDQFAAIAYLRWRLFVNGFRRKGSNGELVARLFLYPIAALIALMPILGSGFGAYYGIAYNTPHALGVVTWGMLVLTIVLSINLSPAALAFDPAALIRYPLSFPTYLTTRLFLGVLSPSTVVCTISLIAATIGVGIARPMLIPIAALAFGLYAVTLMLMTRMAFVWVDRWLGTRRGRSIFTGVMFAFGLTAQFSNFYFTSEHSRVHLQALAARLHLAAHLPALIALGHQISALSVYLPPGLASTAIDVSVFARNGFSPEALPMLAGIVTFGCLFLSVFAARMLKEFRGENLSETAQIPAPATHAGAPRLASETWAPSQARTQAPASRSQILYANIVKELLYLKRSGPLVFILLSPLIVIYFMAGHLGADPGTAPWVFPAAAVYSLLGISAGSYNCFGADLAGTQMYFLAPVRLRDILLAKNLITFVTLAVQVLLTWFIVTLALQPPSPVITIATTLWFIFAVLVNTIVGNTRSITAPKRLDPGKSVGRQASPLSAFMGMGVLVGCAAFGAGAIWLANRLHQPWLSVAVTALLAAGSVVAYLLSLDQLETTALRHREAFSEELCKV
ncbi:ABC-2 type transport system permease protein [Granulicella rosea]|uniref:ABC-2 type transport system permease protein n=1 Tax=Granulicella rosea TaxID=474952 RepID=A0A239E537_9BACT|nr:hypothetical protein [Granulicella rosea]SNS39747.1 ABC-2 type transport system permease protein [Granulicella rosea]